VLITIVSIGVVLFCAAVNFAPSWTDRVTSIIFWTHVTDRLEANDSRTFVLKEDCEIEYDGEDSYLRPAGVPRDDWVVGTVKKGSEIRVKRIVTQYSGWAGRKIRVFVTIKSGEQKGETVELFPSEFLIFGPEDENGPEWYKVNERAVPARER